MRILSILLLLAAASVLDGTVTARLAIGPSTSNAVMPDAFLVALAVWLLLNRRTWALAGAVAIGLACDLSAASRLGIVMLAYCSAGMACGCADERWPQIKLARVGTRLAAALGVPLVLAVALKMTGDVSATWLILGGRALAVGGFSLALALPVTLAMHWCAELWGRNPSTHEYEMNRRATTF